MIEEIGKVFRANGRIYHVNKKIDSTSVHGQIYYSINDIHNGLATQLTSFFAYSEKEALEKYLYVRENKYA